MPIHETETMTYTCQECDAVTNEHIQEYINAGVCGSCAFWCFAVEKKATRVISQSWHCYTIGSPDDYPKGFGGRKWRIRFADGRLVETDSLWHNGLVPPHFRKRLPINATLTQEGYL